MIHRGLAITGQRRAGERRLSDDMSVNLLPPVPQAISAKQIEPLTRRDARAGGPAIEIP